MGAGGASTGGGGGGVGPAGLVTKTGKTGTVKDAKKVSNRNQLRKIARSGGVILSVLRSVGEGIEKAAKPYNLKRRKKFLSAYNTSVPPGEKIDMTDQQIGSKEGLASLKNIGYKTNQDIVKESQQGGDGNNYAMIKKNIGGKIVSVAPTSAEVSQSEAANATSEEDSIYTRKKKTKARGRSTTILSSSKGVKDDDLTLGKPSLLGKV